MTVQKETASGQTTDGETEAYAAVDDMCRRLRDRGDVLSIEAAAHIEGSHQAFADLGDERIEQRDKLANLQRNFDSISSLWGRVSHKVRMEVVHGRKEPAGAR